MTQVGDMMFHLGGVPVDGEFTTGSVFFVHSSGSNSNLGVDPDSPFATLAYAITQLTASKNDIIYLMPGHTGTTTAIPANVVGINIKGVGHGAARPTITATTGASDLINVTAASFRMDNVILVGAASGCTALIDLSSAADSFHLSNCRLKGLAAPTAHITIAPGANEGLVEHCYFTGVAGWAKGISFENSEDGTENQGWIMRHLTFDATVAVGCDDACIEFKTSSGGVTGVLIEDCDFIGLADGDHAIDPQATSTGRATGMVKRCNYHGADVTDSFVESDLLGYIECHAVVAGDHSSASMLSTDRTPKLSPNP